MPMVENARAAAAIHRKLRALAAIFSDPSATVSEKRNAEQLKLRLEEQLTREAPPLDREVAPQPAWTSLMFRLGRGVKEITSTPAQNGDWTGHAFRLGRMFRKTLKR
ncbi:MAG: hypothetical protein JO228_03855 [Xanthobacteraceae bacterium]|nr:hypothetical protein [Xanthobacteraceae bacterium]